jgi:1,4-dihydroxy-2-naphthoate phytyltransferase
MTTRTVKPANGKLWMAAIKPPMYTVAVTPIWVGTAVAISQTQTLHTQIFSTFLVSAILIVAWLNMTNDVFDSETGIDVNKAHSLVNLTGNKSLIFWLANLFLALGVLGILGIAGLQKDPTVLGLVLVSCALGYTYQGPPFRLGYLGLGEIICFFTFGPLAIAAAYYSQTQSWSTMSLAASVIIGVTTSLILFCSHFHQVADDIAAGKKSPIVRLGTQRSAQLLPWICGITYGLIVLFVALKVFPVGTLLSLLSVPVAIQLCRHVIAYYDEPDRVSNSKFIAVNLHFWSGLLLGLGFIF